jgi:DNA-binding CsgD family transcriptional regulator
MLDLVEAPVPALARDLSYEERRVLLGLAHGLVYWQIGEVEGFSSHWAEQRAAEARRALGAASNAHAVSLGHAHALLPWERFARPRLLGEEPQLLAWIARGLRNREIGELLGRRMESVKNASWEMFRRMGAAGRENAVHIGWCTGWLGGGLDG